MSMMARGILYLGSLLKTVALFPLSLLDACLHQPLLGLEGGAVVAIRGALVSVSGDLGDVLQRYRCPSRLADAACAEITVPDFRRDTGVDGNAGCASRSVLALDDTPPPIPVDRVLVGEAGFRIDDQRASPGL